MQASRLLLLAKRTTAPRELLALFQNGQKGGIWLPYVTRSMFQDAAMTIPAVPGMPVVKALDLSGNGNTTTFANVTLERDSAGLLYLAANGTSSTGQTAAIDFTGTDKMTVLAGARKLSDAAIGQLMEFGTNTSAVNGSFMVSAPAGLGTPGIDGVYARGTAYTGATFVTAAPATSVIAGTVSIAEDSIVYRKNGAVVGTSSADLGTGNFGNLPLYWFSRAASSLFFNGRSYGLVVRGAASTAGELADAERAMARLTGVNF